MQYDSQILQIKQTSCPEILTWGKRLGIIRSGGRRHGQSFFDPKGSCSGLVWGGPPTDGSLPRFPFWWPQQVLGLCQLGRLGFTLGSSPNCEPQPLLSHNQAYHQHQILSWFSSSKPKPNLYKYHKHAQTSMRQVRTSSPPEAKIQQQQCHRFRNTNKT